MKIFLEHVKEYKLWLLPVFLTIILSTLLLFMFPNLRNTLFIINIITTLVGFMVLFLSIVIRTYPTSDNLLGLSIGILFLNIIVGYGIAGNVMTMKKVYEQIEPTTQFNYIKLKDSSRIFIDEIEFSSHKISLYNKLDSIKKEDITIIKKYNSYGSSNGIDILINGEEL